MSGSVNSTRSVPKKVLMVVANPAVSTTGWPVGFWASELTHPWYEFREVGYEVVLASPDGGKVEVDALRDPRDPSGYSAGDVLSMGFLSTPGLVEMLESTEKLSEVDLEGYDAIVVCGGQSPMFTFRDNGDLKRALAYFYEAEKPTAALCHGTAALMDVELSDGSYLIEGKTITGFADVEEEAADAAAGQKVMPWHIEDAAKERGANYVEGGLWKAYAVRDGRLITGQQQFSGREVARLVIEALGT
ncbi:MAG: type 1 glutamine amidotransferase domain-containing protein [Rubrobacter sp.]